MSSKQSKPMNLPRKEEKKKSSVKQQRLQIASWVFPCWQLHVQQVGLRVGGKQTGLEACEMGFFFMQGFGLFGGMSTLFEFQFSSRRCCCVDYLFWVPCIPLDEFFSAKQWWGEYVGRTMCSVSWAVWWWHVRKELVNTPSSTLPYCLLSFPALSHTELVSCLTPVGN